MAKQSSRSKVATVKAAMELKGIRLIEAHSKVGQFKPNQLPDRGNQETQVQFQQVDPKGRLANVMITLRLTVTYSEPEAIGPPPLQVTAQYLLQYASASRIDPKSLEDFLRDTAVANVWPHWREFVQSMTVRLGLPAFPLPALVPQGLEKKQNQKKARK